MRITDNWKLRDFNVGEAKDLEVASPDYIDYFWMATTVPGDVHSTLIDRGVIDHPFYGHQDQKCRWVEEKIWWYRTVFTHDGVVEPQSGERPGEDKVVHIAHGEGKVIPWHTLSVSAINGLPVII